MPDPTPYTPPSIWQWNKENGGQFASINRPIAGPTHDKELPVGKHPLQLYSLGTPNGVKVTIMLEELLALGELLVPGASGGVVQTRRLPPGDERVRQRHYVAGGERT